MTQRYTDEERKAFLKAGSELMQRQASSHLQRHARFTTPSRARPVECEVHYQWPGVVLVIDRYTHEVIAESEPGKPFTLAG